MGDKIVQVPGVGNVSFPGTMSDDDISAAIAQQYPAQGTQPQQPRSFMDVLKGVNNVLDLPNQVGIGELKGAGRTAAGLAQMAGYGAGFANPGLTDAGMVAAQKIGDLSNQYLQPSNTAQKVGGYAEGGAEIALPFLRGASALPSTERAGQAFQSVMSAAADNPVPITDELSGALSRYQDLVDAGGSRSLSVSKLLNRITDPQQGPMTYEEGRDFYSNLSRLSANEMNRLSPVMQRQVTTIKGALNNAIQQTATSAGQGAQYAGAMSEYAKAMRLRDFLQSAKEFGVDVAKAGLPAGLTGLAIKYGLNLSTGGNSGR